MGYANHAYRQKPPCWGEEEAFNPDGDAECSGCAFQHSCRSEIMRSNDRPSVYRPRVVKREQQFRRRDDNDVEGEHEAGIVEENETALQRFMKDGAAGAMRGMFYEFYQFWKRYRIP
jgi:hypothetical protein